jgi:hypothetical protein
MFSAIGAQIAPISYTPPARVFTDYSGRYVQNTGVLSDLRNMSGLGTHMRAAHAGDIRYNAASDLGERMALAAAGLGMGMASLGVTTAGSMAGGAMFGTLGSLAGGIGAPIAAAALVGDRVQQGVAQRRDIMNYLETTSDRYVVAGSPLADPRHGAGFSSAARKEVTEYIRGLDIKDPMLNTDELTRILKESTQQGLFTGTSTMNDFKKRFKDVVDNVKVVATTLHQTLEEGIKTIHDLRAVGVDPSRVAGVVGRAEAYGLAAGKSAGEMLNLGLQGAEMFRGTGVGMTIGMESNMMNAVAIRAARDAKMLSDEAVAQAGGEESLAQRMTASSLGFVQTAQGRGFMGMMFNKGLPGTGFDAGAFNKMVAAGGGDLYAGAARAAQNLSSPAATVKFEANQAGFATELGKRFGGQGLQVAQMAEITMEATALSKMSGASMEDSWVDVALKRGLDDTTARAMLAKIRSGDAAFTAAQAGVESSRQKMQEDQISQNQFTTRVGARIGAAVKTATDTVSRPIANAVESAKQGAANAGDWINNGTQRVSLNGTDYDLFAGETVGKSDEQRIVDIDFGGILNDNAGQSLAKLVVAGKTDFLNLRGRAGGNVTLTKGTGLFQGALAGTGIESAAVNVTLEDLRAAGKEANKWAESSSDAAAAVSKAGLAKAMDFKLAHLENTSAKTIDALARQVYGKDADKLSIDEARALRTAYANVDEYSGIFKDVEAGASGVKSALNAVSVSKEVGNLEAANAAANQFSESIMPHGLFGGHAAIPMPVLARLAKVRSIAAAGGDTKAAVRAYEMSIDALTGEQRAAIAPHTQEMLQAATGAGGSSLDVIGRNYAELSDEQVRRGSEILGTALQNDLFSKAGLEKVGEGDRNKILEISKTLAAGGAQAVLGLSGSDLGLLNKTSLGTIFEQEHKALSGISALGRDASAAQISEVVGTTAGPAVAQRVTDALAMAKPGTNLPGLAESVVHATEMQQLAGNTNVATAGTGGTVGAAAGSGDQAAATQTAINLEVLNAMRAFAKQIGSQ